MAGSKLDSIQYLQMVFKQHGGCGPIMASGIMKTHKGKFLFYKIQIFNILVVFTHAQNQTTVVGI